MVLYIVTQFESAPSPVLPCPSACPPACPHPNNSNNNNQDSTSRPGIKLCPPLPGRCHHPPPTLPPENHPHPASSLPSPTSPLLLGHHQPQKLILIHPP